MADGRWILIIDSREYKETKSNNFQPHNPLAGGHPNYPVARSACKTISRPLGEFILILSFPDLFILRWHTFRKIANNAITLAPSKTFNLAGLSTSVIISNPVLRKSFIRIIDNLHIGNGNIFGTIASIAAYSHGHEWLDSLLDYIDHNIDFVQDYCRKIIPEIIPVQPEATYDMSIAVNLE
jgi:hypothetical protein